MKLRLLTTILIFQISILKIYAQDPFWDFTDSLFLAHGLNLRANISEENEKISILLDEVRLHENEKNDISLKKSREAILQARKLKDITYFRLAVQMYAKALAKNDDSTTSQTLQSFLAEKSFYENMQVIDEQNELIKKVVLFALLPVLTIFSFFIFIFYRNRREILLKQRESDLKNEVLEIEMKALRAQMNPHFLFNCLNSIYKFMQQEDTKSAGDYLVRFSKLIRAVLENSNYKEVLLSDDLTTLELYIQMEQLRLNNKFEYKIEIDTNINANQVFIPPLLLQPFVENSIWHGLNNKKQHGLLTIKIELVNDTVRYSIIDNGTAENGDYAKNDLTSTIKKTSLGASLTKDRIDLLNRTRGWNAKITETTLLDHSGNYAGCSVQIFLPYLVE